MNCHNYTSSPRTLSVRGVSARSARGSRVGTTYAPWCEVSGRGFAATDAERRTRAWQYDPRITDRRRRTSDP